MTIVAMAFLTFLGASAGSPTEIDLKVAPQFEAGKQVAAQSGCLACHKFGENGNDGPGPELTEIGAKLPAQAHRAHADQPLGRDAVMPDRTASLPPGRSSTTWSSSSPRCSEARAASRRRWS